MAILTILLFVILVIATYNFVLIYRKDYKDINKTRKRIKYLKSIGTFSLVVGFLGQMLGLYQAFSVIEQAKNISPGLLAGGLKISMISPLYGTFIFLISYLLWFAVDSYASRQQ